MKLRSLSAAVLTVALGATGLLVAAPGATAASSTASATATATASSAGTTITASAYDQIVGTTRSGATASVVGLAITVPGAFTYRGPSGSLRVAEVDWVVTGSAVGDPSCMQKLSTATGKGSGAAVWKDTVWKDTDPGRCTVTLDIYATRTVEDHPEASYEARATVTVPLKYIAPTFFTDVTTSATSRTKGQSVTVSGKLKADDAYRLSSASVLRNVAVDIEETTGNPSSATAKWRKVKTVKTSATGEWRATFKPSRSVAYRATYKGAEIYLASKSTPTRIVKVTTPAASKLSAPKASASKIKKGKASTISGKATLKSGTKYKAYAKAKVTVQKKVGKKWKTVKTVTASKTGAWKLKVKPTKTTSYRAILKKTTKSKAATSRTVKVTVRR